MAKKKQSLDPQMQALVDQALASGDPLGFMSELTREVQGQLADETFAGNPEIQLPDAPCTRR